MTENFLVRKLEQIIFMYCHSPITLCVVIFPNLRFHNSNDDQDKKLALHKKKTAVLPAKELELFLNYSECLLIWH